MRKKIKGRKLRIGDYVRLTRDISNVWCPGGKKGMAGVIIKGAHYGDRDGSVFYWVVIDELVDSKPKGCGISSKYLELCPFVTPDPADLDALLVSKRT